MHRDEPERLPFQAPPRSRHRSRRRIARHSRPQRPSHGLKIGRRAEEMTRRMSPVAVCCSRASVSACPRRSTSALPSASTDAEPALEGWRIPRELRLRPILVLARGTCIPSVSRVRIVRGPAPDHAARHPGTAEARRPGRSVGTAPQPYRDPASGARWAVLGRGSPWSLRGDPIGGSNSQSSPTPRS